MAGAEVVKEEAVLWSEERKGRCHSAAGVNVSEGVVFLGISESEEGGKRGAV